ncbi:MAG: lipoprotein [Epsilonproteobacteria bacterium]|nr:lipoprotein [Campylobacterota bacterium]
MKKIIFAFLLILIVSGCAQLNVNRNSYVTPTANLSAPIIENAIAGERSVLINWRSVPDAGGYEIFRGSCAKCNFVSIGKTDKNITRYLDKGGLLGHLGDNMSYFYRVAALDSSDNLGKLSRVIKATTIGAPQPPVNPAASKGKAQKIIITWRPSDDPSVIGYKLYRSRAIDTQFALIARISGRLNSLYVDRRLKNGTKYFYRISSFNRVGATGTLSKAAAGVTKFPPLPPPVVKAISNMPKRSVVIWQPSPNNDIKNYYIERSKPGENFYRIAVVDGHTTRFIDKNLDAGTTYRYRIRAIDKDNIKSEYSVIAAATTKPLPLAPTQLSIDEMSNGNIMISWKKSETKDVTGYVIWKRYWLVVTQEAGKSDGTTFVDNNVKRNTSYTYWIKSVDEAGQFSKNSKEITIKTSK